MGAIVSRSMREGGLQKEKSKLAISQEDVFAGLTDGPRGLLAPPNEDGDDGPPRLDDDGPPGLDEFDGPPGLDEGEEGFLRTPGMLVKQGTMAHFGAMSRKVEIDWNPPGTPPSPLSGNITPRTPSSTGGEDPSASWMDANERSLVGDDQDEEDRKSNLMLETRGPVEFKASSILKKDKAGFMPQFEIPEVLAHLTEDWVESVGDTTGLSEIQCTARRMLKARRAMRSTEAGLVDIFNSEQYRDFVKEFDARVEASQHRSAPEMHRGEALPLVMQLQPGHRESALLESEDFWKEMDALESELEADVKVLQSTETALQREIELMQQELKDEQEHKEAKKKSEDALKSEMKSKRRKAIAADLAAELEKDQDHLIESDSDASDEDEEQSAEDRAAKARRKLVQLFPNLANSEFVRRYAVQRLFWSLPEAMLPPDPLPDKGKLIEVTAQREHDKRMIREVADFHQQKAYKERSREAKTRGAFAPRGDKPERAIVRARLRFPGPIFAYKPLGDVPASKEDDPLLVRGAGGILHVRYIEGYAAGGQYIPPGTAESQPTAPALPSRLALSRASRKRPGVNKLEEAQRTRDIFNKRYGQAVVGSHIPKPPPPPQARAYFPLPWEDLPSHKLKMRGLPMVCTEEDILAFLGAHAADVQDIARDGFKRGVKIFRLADKWLTGEAHVVMKSRRAALDAILYLDKTRMGRRVIQLGYLIEEVPPPRGRLMLGGLHRATTTRDLLAYFRGWDVVEEPGQEPEIFGDVEGEPTGDALVVFDSVDACDIVLRLFDFGHKLRGRELTYEPMLPIKFNPVAEKWEEMDHFHPSTLEILAEIARELGLPDDQLVAARARHALEEEEEEGSEAAMSSVTAGDAASPGRRSAGRGSSPDGGGDRAESPYASRVRTAAGERQGVGVM